MASRVLTVALVLWMRLQLIIPAFVHKVLKVCFRNTSYNLVVVSEYCGQTLMWYTVLESSCGHPILIKLIVLHWIAGQSCEIDINDCLPTNPCANGGTCHDLPNNFTCSCSAQYTGLTCEQLYNACESSPCANNGTCTTQIPSPLYACTCPPGFTGQSLMNWHLNALL